jgi:hypothetical protein
MSKIQEKLDSLQPYIVGIRYLQGLQIVDAVFKEGWTIPDSEILQRELVDESQNYYMFYTEKEGVTIDDILDYVEGVININIEREKKYELLKEKVEELKKVFKDNPLSKLERLKFSFSDKDILPSLSDMDSISVEEEKEVKVEKPKPESPEKIKEASKKVGKGNSGTTKKIKGNDIELPPKDDGKIVVEEFEEPNIKCECGPNDVCPVCEEEKFGVNS